MASPKSKEKEKGLMLLEVSYSYGRYGQEVLGTIPAENTSILDATNNFNGPTNFTNEGKPIKKYGIVECFNEDCKQLANFKSTF